MGRHVIEILVDLIPVSLGFLAKRYCGDGTRTHKQQFVIGMFYVDRTLGCAEMVSYISSPYCISKRVIVGMS